MGYITETVIESLRDKIQKEELLSCLCTVDECMDNKNDIVLSYGTGLRNIRMRCYEKDLETLERSIGADGVADKIIADSEVMEYAVSKAVMESAVDYSGLSSNNIMLAGVIARMADEDEHNCITFVMNCEPCILVAIYNGKAYKLLKSVVKEYSVETKRLVEITNDNMNKLLFKMECFDSKDDGMSVYGVDTSLRMFMPMCTDEIINAAMREMDTLRIIKVTTGSIIMLVDGEDYDAVDNTKRALKSAMEVSDKTDVIMNTSICLYTEKEKKAITYNECMNYKVR